MRTIVSVVISSSTLNNAKINYAGIFGKYKSSVNFAEELYDDLHLREYFIALYIGLDF